MSTTPITPLPDADTGDLVEQSVGLDLDEPLATELTPYADEADALEQQHEIGWDEEHDATD